MKLRNKIVAFFLTMACAFGLAVANNATRVNAAEEKLTITFDDKAKRTAYSTSQQIWVENGITVTNDKSSSTSNVGDYAKPARFYASSKITIATELNITKIVFDANNASYATALKNSIGSTATASSDKVTVTLDGSTNSYVIAKLTAQVRMDSMDVYVLPAVSEDATDEDIVASAIEGLTVPSTVISSITLPTVGAGDAEISWASSDEDTLGVDGKVVLRDVEDTPIELTATVTFGQATATKTFNTVVLGENTLVENTIDALTVPSSVVSSITLPTKANEVVSIAWATDDAEILSNTGKLVARPAEDTYVTLTATVSLGGVSETVEFDVLVKKGLDIVTAPKANTYYKMVLTQGTLNKDLYLTGAMDGYYYGTTEDVSKAALVYLVETTGGYYMLAKVNGTAKYMNVKASGSYTNCYLETSPVSVWKYNSTYNTFVTTVSGTEYYLGCYNSYATYSPSKSSYLTSSTNYPAKLIELTAEEKAEVFGISARVGYQVGTKDESTALRLVAEFDFRAEDLPNYDAEISFKVTRNGVADERVVSTLYSSVNPMNDEEVLEGAYYAVLTYVNVPAGEYTVEVLIDGMVVASVVATVA